MQFHDGNLQDYNLFLYLYSDFWAGNHIPMSCIYIYLLILLMFCHELNNLDIAYRYTCANFTYLFFKFKVDKVTSSEIHSLLL